MLDDRIYNLPPLKVPLQTLAGGLLIGSHDRFAAKGTDSECLLRPLLEERLCRAVGT